jgi:hypothetical protein
MFFHGVDLSEKSISFVKYFSWLCYFDSGIKLEGSGFTITGLDMEARGSYG